MTDKPRTATEALRLDAEQMRLEARDRALAAAVGREMLERYFDADRIVDMRDVREQISRAAEHAAYEAIQRERGLHKGDMVALRLWTDARWTEAMLKPPAPFTPPASSTSQDTVP